MRLVLLLACLIASLAQARPLPAEQVVKAQTALPYLRGVNIGGWLVLEPFLTPELFEANGAVDQWTFDQTPGSADTLRHHWDTYCTESDIKKLASYGVNACVTQTFKIGNKRCATRILR